jgi:hypothetical protein
MLVALACLPAWSSRVDGDAEDLTVDASLTVSAELPDRARHVLVHEAESIWREAGVRIRWVEGAEDAGDRPALRILVVRHGDGRSPDGDAVGELVRPRNGRAIAFASIAGAEQVVQAAGIGPAQAAPEAVLNRRLGMVLGRAVAHEIGHYLLESGAHTGRGLMRATFQPREFSDPRSGAFDVDDASRRRIRGRWTPLLPLPPAAPTQSARCCR